MHLGVRQWGFWDQNIKDKELYQSEQITKD